MFGAPLPAGFYDRDPAVVARELLGAVLRHEDALGVASGRIVDTEAYLGPHDPASHSAFVFGFRVARRRRARIGNYEINPTIFPTSLNAAITASRSSLLCAALT